MAVTLSHWLLQSGHCIQQTWVELRIILSVYSPLFGLYKKNASIFLSYLHKSWPNLEFSSPKKGNAILSKAHVNVLLLMWRLLSYPWQGAVVMVKHMNINYFQIVCTKLLNFLGAATPLFCFFVCKSVSLMIYTDIYGSLLRLSH